MESIKLLFVTNHPTWADSFRCHTFLFCRSVHVIPVAIDSVEKFPFDIISTVPSDLAVIATDHIQEELNFVHALRINKYTFPILIFCSRFALPSLEELETNEVQGIVSSSSSMQELEQALYEVADNEHSVLHEQYERAAKELHLQLPYKDLTQKELETLKLAASDLTDENIAEELNLSHRTVSNRLRRIYVKLGAKTKTGAVVKAISLGLISPSLNRVKILSKEE